MNSENKKRECVLDPRNAIVRVGKIPISDRYLAFIAGPCAAENEEQVFLAAKAAYDAGAHILRGGAFKPRTSPYAFQGHGERALQWLSEAGRTYGMPLVTEVMEVGQIELVSRYADMLQVGSRNMQNFELLKALSLQEKPVLLKRGLSATYEEWAWAAEYVLQGGTAKVVLCERGIRTFETATRNTLDPFAFGVMKRLTTCPIIGDPSHAAGAKDLVKLGARACIAAGSDGVMLDVHPDPAAALCDKEQALLPHELRWILDGLRPLADALGKPPWVLVAPWNSDLRGEA